MIAEAILAVAFIAAVAIASTWACKRRWDRDYELDMWTPNDETVGRKQQGRWPGDDLL